MRAGNCKANQCGRQSLADCSTAVSYRRTNPLWRISWGTAEHSVNQRWFNDVFGSRCHRIVGLRNLVDERLAITEHEELTLRKSKRLIECFVCMALFRQVIKLLIMMWKRLAETPAVPQISVKNAVSRQPPIILLQL